MKIKHKSILLILCSTYIYPINSHGDYKIKDIGHSIYKPFSISDNASQYYEFKDKKYEYIKHRHGKILDKSNYNQQLLFTPFGSVYVYTAINLETRSLYNKIADNENKQVDDIIGYDIRKMSSFFNEDFLPNELFINKDGGEVHNKINKETDKRLDTLFLEKISDDGEVIIGYAKENSKSIFDEQVESNKINHRTHDNCLDYNYNDFNDSQCNGFVYNRRKNTFILLDRNVKIKHLTKDGNFILYKKSKPIFGAKDKPYLYDINKKEEFELTKSNINKYLANHPEKDILLSSITEYPFFDEVKGRGLDIQKISDNGQVFIGQLNRNLSFNKLKSADYPKVAFITTKEGPIHEITHSDFGSSKLTAISVDGNNSVGWAEVWLDNYRIGRKGSSSLFSQAIRYNLSENKLINIGNLSNNHNEKAFRNARATDISADGKYIVGWSETDDYNYDSIEQKRSEGKKINGPAAYIIFHRHGFVHFNNTMYDLGTLNNGKDSEAHAITDDGRMIYGLATDEHNNWRQVIWKNDQISNKYFNAEKQKIVDAKAEQERLAKEQADAKAEQDRLDKERADAKAEQERLAKERADAKAEQERLDKERADAKAEQDRLAKEQADKAKAEQERLAKEQEKIEPSIIASKPIDIENTYKSMLLMAENDYKFMDMQQGQLRHLASATCSVGTEKACISGFAHYQNVNKANATQTGLSGAYRFDINAIPFVVGLAIDTDVYSSLPKGYQYQGYALPLIGFSLDLMPSLNAELNSDALHLSLKGAYLNRKVSIERQILEDTEAGKGNAKISGYHIELQGYFPYSINDDLLLTPFAGLTFNQISRSAYSETQNAQFAVHYDPLNAHSLLAKIGLGMDHLLGSSFILNTKAGFLWDLSHHQGDFGSHIDYLGQQKIDYTENKKQLTQRPFAHIGLTYQVDKHSSIGTKANWEMTTYRNHDMQFGINYAYRF